MSLVFFSIRFNVVKEDRRPKMRTNLMSRNFIFAKNIKITFMLAI